MSRCPWTDVGEWPSISSGVSGKTSRAWDTLVVYINPCRSTYCLCALPGWWGLSFPFFQVLAISLCDRYVASLLPCWLTGLGLEGNRGMTRENIKCGSYIGPRYRSQVVLLVLEEIVDAIVKPGQK